MQPTLKYPAISPRLRRHAGVLQVFDGLRKKWLALTPEEWVRQHVVGFLIHEKKVPAGLISLEKALRLNDLNKRYDVVVFDHSLKPWLIVECKAPYVPLDATVAEQALRYNLALPAAFVMISNGVADVIFRNGKKAAELPDFPAR